MFPTRQFIDEPRPEIDFSTRLHLDRMTGRPIHL
jgi:hypothetical protein